MALSPTRAKGHVAERRAAAPRSPRRLPRRRCTYELLCELTLSSSNRERSHASNVVLAHRIRTSPQHEVEQTQARSGVKDGVSITTARIKPRTADAWNWTASNPSKKEDHNPFTLEKHNNRAPGWGTRLDLRREGTSFMRPQNEEMLLLFR